MSEPQHRKIVLIARRPGFVLGYEQYDNDATLVHIDVTAPWSRELKAAVRKDIDAMFDMHGGPLHAITAFPRDDDPAKFRKFVGMFGFHFNKMVPCADGVTRPAYTRTE